MTAYYLMLTKEMSKEELQEEIRWIDIDFQCDEVLILDKVELAQRKFVLSEKKAHVLSLLKNK
jgi:hypothetical protein